MENHRETVDLPANFRHHFQEYDAGSLSWEADRHTIVLRLLQSGGLEAVRWLRGRMSDGEIRDFLVARRGRGMSPRRLRFWGLVLDIPRARVDRWIEAAKANPWYRRTG